MNLAELVDSKSIIVDLNVPTKQEAIETMVESLKTSGRLKEDEVESIIAAIQKREEHGSTGIGNGVAVPHTKHPSVDELVATIAIAPDGVDFASLDGEPVFILFMLVSPPDRPGDHLRALETISVHLRGEKFCNFLKQATTAEAVIDLLQEADMGQLID